ncbi:unnamed protein product, partial [Adineta ricciae]
VQQTYQIHLQEQTIEKIEIVDANYHSTLCAKCNQVCHNNCRLDETTVVGAQIFAQCVVMFNGKCQQCPNHCSYIHHYHAKKAIRIRKEKLHDALNDVKQKYGQAQADRTNYQEQIMTISETKAFLEKALKEKIREMKMKSVQLCQLCSSFNLAKEFQYLIRQLNTDVNLLKNQEIKKQTDSLIRKLMNFTRLVEENQEKNRQRRSPMQIIDREQPMKEKSIDIKSQKTDDLIKLYHNTIDPHVITLILSELHQRLQGKSTSPLLTSDEMIFIQKSLEKYSQKSVQELSYVYRQLQKQIQRIIDADILKIVHVNAELLIENFIVQTLLDTKEKNETDPEQT